MSNLRPAATALTGLRFLTLFQNSEVYAAQTAREAISPNPAAALSANTGPRAV